MSSQRSSRAAVSGQAHDGQGSGSARIRPRAGLQVADPAPDAEEGSLGPVPSPLPRDPALRAELLSRLDRGIAGALAGRGTDARTVHARLRAKYGLP